MPASLHQDIKQSPALSTLAFAVHSRDAGVHAGKPSFSLSRRLNLSIQEPHFMDALLKGMFGDEDDDQTTNQV